MRRIAVLAVLLALAGTPVAAQILGSSGRITATGTPAPTAASCDSSRELNSYYLQTGNPATVVTQLWECVQTGVASYAWHPISHKVGTTAPVTCVIGQVFFDSNATAGSNWFGCTATNTWTLLGGAGGGGTPGSIDTTIQYNNGGVFGGDAGLTYNDGTQTATIENLNVNTAANLPWGTYFGGYFDMLAQVAPATPAAGRGRPYVDSTSKNIAIKDDAGVIKHGVQTKVAVANSFATAIDDAGVVTVLQPTPAHLGAGTLATATTVGAGGSVAPTSPTVGVVSANQINGVALSGLATGPLANTITTGVPRAASVTDMSIPVFGVDGGATDSYVVVLAPSITTCVTGTSYRFKANTANTGAATVDFGCGAKTIKRVAGGITTDLITTDIRAGQWVDLIYDGTNMQMQSTSGNAAAASADAVLGASVLTTDGTVPIVSAVDGTLAEGTGVTIAAGVVTATGFAGPLTGDVVGNADSATALAADPADCGAGDFVTGMTAAGVLTCDAPAAAGVGSSENLTDFAATVTTTTQADDTVNIAAGRARIGSYAPNAILAGTAQFTAGSGDVKVFIDENNNLVCLMATGITYTPGGSMTCSNAAAPAYPANSIPIADLTVSAAQAVSIDSDDRAVYTVRGVGAGTGISVTEAGGVASIGIDEATVPTLAGADAYTGAPDFSGTTSLRVRSGSGAPAAGECDAAGEVGSIYARSDAAAANATFYVCSNTAAATYAWEMIAGGSGTVSASSADEFTNKEIDAEATGNVITVPKKIWIPAAVCQNATATLNWDTPVTDPAVAICVTGTNTQKGAAAFANTGSLSMQQTIALPADWSGAIDARFKWYTAATSGSVVWQIATICVADAETDDPAFNTASVVADAAKGTTLQLNDASITGVTATGCAAGELMHVKVLRDSAHASDDLADTANLIGVELTLRRAM